MTDKERAWIAFRGGEPCEVFAKREQAVKWLKGLLKQTLKNYQEQDKPCQFDYEILFERLEIRRVRFRTEDMGL